MRPRSFLLAVVASLLFGCSGGGGGPTEPPPGAGNHSPTANLNINNVHLAYAGTAQLSVTATDPDGDQLTFSWSATLGTVSSSGPTASTATFTAGSQWGQAQVTVTVSDGKGGSAQATALTYVRNPNPPAFSFFPDVIANSCGYGTPNPEGFVLRLTPAEAVLISTIVVGPRDTYCFGGCQKTRNYTNAIGLSAGQQYLWIDGSCLLPDCCYNNGCGSNCPFWQIRIVGRRPEPDGGSFEYRCNSWSPLYPSTGCN